MVLTTDQLENVVGYLLEHGSRTGFVRVSLSEIERYRITARPDGSDALITSHEEGRRMTDKFPLLPNMGS